MAFIEHTTISISNVISMELIDMREFSVITPLYSFFPIISEAINPALIDAISLILFFVSKFDIMAV